MDGETHIRKGAVEFVTLNVCGLRRRSLFDDGDDARGVYCELERPDIEVENGGTLYLSTPSDLDPNFSHTLFSHSIFDRYHIKQTRHR